MNNVYVISIISAILLLVGIVWSKVTAFNMFIKMTYFAAAFMGAVLTAQIFFMS